MKTINLILLAVSAIALILAVLMGINIIQTTLLNLDGRDFCLFSVACTLLAIGLHIIQPLGGKQEGEA
jgi:hypothetical protein